MSEEEKYKWNKAYEEGRFQSHFEGPRSVTVDWATPLLPETAEILDVGCGILRNCKELADAGHHVLAIDVAKEAFLHAPCSPPNLETMIKDLDDWEPPKNSFDLVIMVHYLNRELLDGLAQSLRPGGLLALEIRSPLSYETEKPIPRYWLRSEELNEVFPSLVILKQVNPTADSKSVKALLKRA